MKDIKTLMIGFLLATCMFLMMGQGNLSQNLDFEVVGNRYFIYDSTNNKVIEYGSYTEVSSTLLFGANEEFVIADLRNIAIPRIND
tara:strand:+ start:1566 stop:1823 length:258 start_codon:yes stop_codon:yes gene_type:complete